jgi:hypothetical protein
LNVSVNNDKISETSKKQITNEGFKNNTSNYNVEFVNESLEIKKNKVSYISKEIDLEKRISKINNKVNCIVKSVNPSETEFSS